MLDRIGAAISRWQDATERFDEAVGMKFDLGPADRHCLALLSRGAQPAGAIAREIGIKPASVTALLDRLEQRGLIQRTPDSTDRRKVIVTLTAVATSLVRKIYGPMARDGEKILRGFSDAELATIDRFIDETLEQQLRNITRIETEFTKATVDLRSTE